MKRQLSVLSLALITVSSVDSIRNLPVAALAGSQLFTYFSLALIFFLLPGAIISAWFSHQSQQGVYGWVRQGMGQRSAFMAIWFQCVQNVLIYPTMLSFIAGTLLYSLSPELAQNKIAIFSTIVVLIWGLTWVNLKGIHTSAAFNAFCSIAGLLVPFIIILCMGLFWYLSHWTPDYQALPAATPYSWTSLTAIILSFCGIELAAVHAEDSKPGAFPKAVALSVFIIFASMLFGSMTIAMIIPAHQLSFISSIPQLISLFFTKLHIGQLSFIVNGLIAIGCMGAANNWLIAPIRGLGFAAREGFLSSKLTAVNQNQAPTTLLILQAMIVTLISTLFLIIPAINASYWIMLNAATQINLLMYLLLFISALLVSLRQAKDRLKIISAVVAGLLGVIVTLIISFTPPPSLHFASQLRYAIFGGLFLLVMAWIPIQGSRAALSGNPK